MENNSNLNGDGGGGFREDDFKTDAACVTALAEAMMTLPSMLQFARELLQGITRPTLPQSEVCRTSIEMLRAWIFEGKPAVPISVPSAIVPMLIALNAPTHIPYKPKCC